MRDTTIEKLSQISAILRVLKPSRGSSTPAIEINEPLSKLPKRYGRFTFVEITVQEWLRAYHPGRSRVFLTENTDGCKSATTRDLKRVLDGQVVKKEYEMSSSQPSELLLVPRTSYREQPETPANGCESTIGLKEVAEILNCSVEQCRRLAQANKIPMFRIGYRWKSTASAIVNWREEQLAWKSHSRPPEER